MGCELEGAGSSISTESSFAAIGPAAGSAFWFSQAVEPASPALAHFLHPAGGVDAAFEPVSPALEHFLHPLSPTLGPQASAGARTQAR